MAAAHVALAGWMVIGPDSFTEQVAGYPPQEAHFLGDIATWTAALGIAFAVAAEHSSWRVPVLGLAAIQYALHTVNHVWDAGETDPAALGPVNAILLGTATLLLTRMALRRRTAAR